jgi:flagellar biogenesis protein FliO
MKQTRSLLAVAGFLGVLWGSVPVRCQEPVPGGPSVSEPEFMKPDSAPTFPVVRVVLTLGLLMGGLYFVRPWLKKMKWAGAPLAGGTGLDVVARAYLGPRAGLCLVQAEGRRFLVGVGADGVRLLADLGVAPMAEPESPRG